MGRTVPTYRLTLEAVLASWEAYRRALRRADAAAFEDLLRKARAHSSAASLCPHLEPAEAAFLSILLEMQREIEVLKGERETNGGSPLLRHHRERLRVKG